MPSSCSEPCPQYRISQNIISQNTEYNAENSIVLNPGFQVPLGKVFKAEVGCGSSSGLISNDSNAPLSLDLNTCTFDWDIDKSYSVCEGANTRYFVYVKNIPYDSYPEFSADNITWYKASIGSSGHEFLLPGNSGWTIYARMKNKPSEVIQHTFTNCSTGSTPINFNNTLRTKLCSGGQITQTVYIDNLASGATAQFSTDGGSTWANANVGSNGFAFTQIPTNSYQSFMAKSSSHPTSFISSQYHSSCSNISGMNWGPYNVGTHQPGICKYEVSVTGLATDSWAEFSIDNGVTWFKAQVGNYGHIFYLYSNSQTFQDFWFRPMERPDYSGTWGHLSVCN